MVLTSQHRMNNHVYQQRSLLFQGSLSLLKLNNLNGPSKSISMMIVCVCVGGVGGKPLRFCAQVPLNPFCVPA